MCHTGPVLVPVLVPLSTDMMLEDVGLISTTPSVFKKVLKLFIELRDIYPVLTFHTCQKSQHIEIWDILFRTYTYVRINIHENSFRAGL